ncbi:uncharacterized protein A1O9_13144, partial [Exophiala aquamarina CBS 119918]
MKTPKNQSAKARTVKWHEVPEWRVDNRIICSGYRLAKGGYVGAFTGLTTLHNETFNVYTHLIGALLLPFIAFAFMSVFSDPRFLNVSIRDYVVFGLYFMVAEACLIFSAVYHLMKDHSEKVAEFWHGMDLLGIVIVTAGTFASAIYYIFLCEPRLQKVHWAIILTSSTVTAVLISNPAFRTLRWRSVRVGVYFALGASSFIPLLHGVQRYGLGYMLQYAGMKWYLIELVLYGGGTGLYAFRIPERLAPGKFDICGSSHQIFHILIVCAMPAHMTALMHAFTECHTLDLCKIKG